MLVAGDRSATPTKELQRWSARSAARTNDLAAIAAGGQAPQEQPAHHRETRCVTAPQHRRVPTTEPRPRTQTAAHRSTSKPHRRSACHPNTQPRSTPQRTHRNSSPHDGLRPIGAEQRTTTTSAKAPTNSGGLLRDVTNRHAEIHERPAQRNGRTVENEQTSFTTRH